MKYTLVKARIKVFEYKKSIIILCMTNTRTNNNDNDPIPTRKYDFENTCPRVAAYSSVTQYLPTHNSTEY